MVNRRGRADVSRVGTRAVFRVAGGPAGRRGPGHGGGLYPAGDAELAQDVADVHAGGAGADVQLGADLAGVGAPGGQQRQHRQLTGDQPVAGQPGPGAGLRVRRRPPAAAGSGPARPGCGSGPAGGRARRRRPRRRAARRPPPRPGCPASSCASACRHHAYPARCGSKGPAGFGRAVPGTGIAGAVDPGPLGVPGGALGRDGGHGRVVGERDAALFPA